MSIRLDGKVASAAIKENLKEQFASFDKKACLAIVHFNDPASMSYLNGRLKIANEVGVEVKIIDASEASDTSKLVNIINELNNDTSVNGIMVDRPVPKKYDEASVLNAISPVKDVDGCSALNLGYLLANKDCFYPCTPSAAVRLAEYYNVELEGKNALVVGRSLNVGKPLSLLLLNKNATVTVCHSKTKEIKELIKRADIVFLCLGKAGFLTKDDVNDKQVVIDIGINYNAEGKLCGDASSEIYELVNAYSPVPGGVGVLTNVCLMENLIKAKKRQN